MVGDISARRVAVLALGNTSAGLPLRNTRSDEQSSAERKLGFFVSVDRPIVTFMIETGRVETRKWSGEL